MLSSNTLSMNRGVCQKKKKLMEAGLDVAQLINGLFGGPINGSCGAF